MDRPAPTSLTRMDSPTSLTLSSVTSIPLPPLPRHRLPKACVFVRTPPKHVDHVLSDMSDASLGAARRYEFTDDFASVADSEAVSAVLAPAMDALRARQASLAAREMPQNLRSSGKMQPHMSLGSTLKYHVPDLQGRKEMRSKISFRGKARGEGRAHREESIMHDWERAVADRKEPAKRKAGARRRARGLAFAFWKPSRKEDVRERREGMEMVPEDTQFVRVGGYEEFMHGRRPSKLSRLIARIRGQ